MDGWMDKKKKSDKVMIRRDRVWYDKIYLSLCEDQGRVIIIINTIIIILIIVIFILTTTINYKLEGGVLMICKNFLRGPSVFFACQTFWGATTFDHLKFIWLCSFRGKQARKLQDAQAEKLPGLTKMTWWHDGPVSNVYRL